LRVFLVRHAESEANALNVHGGPGSALTQKGVKEAETLAKRFAGVDVDLILCSKYKRAQQTAKIMGDELGKKVVYYDQLAEWRAPSEFEGQDATRVEQSVIWDKLWTSTDSSWHYSDEENLFELTKRAKAVLDHIKSMKEESMIVIMHGAFMGIFMGLLFFGDKANNKELRRAYDFFITVNASVTELEINKSGDTKLITFNDFAHLK